MKGRLAIAVLAGAIVALPVGIYASGGGRLLYLEPSPDGRERVEFHTPSRWQGWVSKGHDLAGVVRLVRTSDAEPIGNDSPVIELSGAGSAIWSGSTVQVGTTAVFDRKTGEWQTEP